MQGYEVPAAGAESELVVKKSRFIARVRRVATRAEAMACIEEFHLQHPQARHLCWAYLFGPETSSSAAMNDDGEPSGTAGRPILNVIQHKKISDTLIMVVRYFGGIKLGTGGLTRAYSASAEAVLQICPRQRFEAMQEYRLAIEFSQETALRHWLQLHHGQLLESEYGAVVVMRLSIPQSMASQLDDYIKHLGCKILD